jgi:uncharacterized protein YxjI
MMSDTDLGFIESSSISVYKVQSKIIDGLIKEYRSKGMFINRHAMDSKRQEIEAKIRSKNRVFSASYVAPREKITAEYFNESFSDIYIDLYTLYQQMALMSVDNSRLSITSKDSLLRTKAAINETITQLRLYRFLKLNPQYDDAKFVSFINATNRTKLNPKAEVDIKTRKLKGPTSDTSRLSVARFNLDSVNAEIKHYGGGVSTRDEVTFGIDKSIDDNTETFFADVVLTEGIPNHTYRLSHSKSLKKLGSGWQDGCKFKSNGIVFETIYTFSKTARCNQIRIYPIADYPLKLVDICYKNSDLSDTWKPIPGFDPDNYPETLDWIEWNGHRFHASQIKVVFEQANYSTKIFHLPGNIAKNNQLWAQIIDKNYQESIHNIDLDEVLADKIAVHPEYLSYLNELNDLQENIYNTSLIKESEIKHYDVAESLQEVTLSHMAKTDVDYAREFTDRITQRKPKIEAKRLQFIYGLRSIEINDKTYKPFSFYESQKFTSNSNINEIELDTNENHIESLDGLTTEPYQLTSTEWEIEVGNGIYFPIAPYKNMIEDDDGNRFVKVRDEVLIINRQNRNAITRFKAFLNGNINKPSVLVRKNGVRVSPLAINSGLGGQSWEENYTIDLTSDNRIKINFNDKYFDKRSIYTISYNADSSAAILDLKESLNSDTLEEPEKFRGVEESNRIDLKHYPYIEYGIINDDINWTQDDEEVSRWRFVPSSLNYSVGTISISGNTVSGDSTTWVTNGVKELVTGEFNGLTGAALKVPGDNRIYKIESVEDEDSLTLSDPFETGFLPNGSEATGLPYVIGKIKEIDGQYFGLDNSVYEPLKVYVSDVKALNKTNYNTLEHESFLPVSSQNRIFEYLQAGKYIYFNAPIEGEIEVEYRYLTEYVKVNATLRSHKSYGATATPEISDYMLRLKTSKL